MAEVPGNLGFFESSSNNYSNLLGQGDHNTKGVLIGASQTLELGHPVGKKDVSGEDHYFIADKDAVDGTDVPEGILLDDAIVTGVGEQKRATILTFGNIVKEGLVLTNTNYTQKEIEPLLRNKGMSIEFSVKGG